MRRSRNDGRAQRRAPAPSSYPGMFMDEHVVRNIEYEARVAPSRYRAAFACMLAPATNEFVVWISTMDDQDPLMALTEVTDFLKPWLVRFPCQMFWVNVLRFEFEAHSMIGYADDASLRGRDGPVLHVVETPAEAVMDGKRPVWMPEEACWNRALREAWPYRPDDFRRHEGWSGKEFAAMMRAAVTADEKRALVRVWNRVAENPPPDFMEEPERQRIDRAARSLLGVSIIDYVVEIIEEKDILSMAFLIDQEQSLEKAIDAVVGLLAPFALQYPLEAFRVEASRLLGDSIIGLGSLSDDAVRGLAPRTLRRIENPMEIPVEFDVFRRVARKMKQAKA